MSEHSKGRVCRSSKGDVTALPIKSITSAASAQAWPYFRKSHQKFEALVSIWPNVSTSKRILKKLQDNL